MKKTLILILIVVLSAGCIKKCPASCFDDNPCTADYCSNDTGYACKYNNLTGPVVGCNTTVDCVQYECISGRCAGEPVESCETYTP